MTDPLDDNIGKLLRGARASEPSRPGAKERVFGNVLRRLKTQPVRRSNQFVRWSAAALAACIAAAVLVHFSQKSPAAIPPVADVKPDRKVAPVVQPEIVPPRDVRIARVLRAPDGAPLRETLPGGGTIELAKGSEAELALRENDAVLRLTKGTLQYDGATRNERVVVNSPLGSVTGTSATFRVVLTPNLNDAVESKENESIKLKNLAALTMTVSVQTGEVVIRGTGGVEQLAVAGEDVTVRPDNQKLVENWRSGQLVPKLENGVAGEPLEVRRHQVRATINEQVALVEVDQTFFNTSERRLEGTFVFPLPHGATICRLAMYSGDNLMEGEIAEAQRARRTFEALMVQQIDPALLEWAGGNTFKMRVFPIEPKSEKRLLISYYEVLKKERNKISFSYPLASDATQKFAVGEIDVSVSVKSTAAIELSSTPEYDAKIDRTPHALEARYNAKAVRPTRDFQLQYQTAGGGAEVVVLPYWHARRNEGYFMMIFSPELEKTASEKRRGYQFVFVVDKTSGIGQRHLSLAVKTIKAALGHLTLNDRFSIVGYDTIAEKFKPALIEATPESIAEAGRWLDSLEAMGAGDLSEAWKTAAELADGDTQVVYVGTGLSALGSTQSGKLLAQAEAAFAGKEVRVQCLPVGPVQDQQLLAELSKKYQGTMRPVNNVEDAQEAAAELLEDFTWPLYRDVQWSFNNLPMTDIYPRQLPNVTAGRQLVVFGKYKSPCEGEITLTANCEGKHFEKVLPVKFGSERTDAFIPKLWATRYIEQLQMDMALDADAPSEAIKRIVIEASKRYRVMSQFTSFIVLETAEDYMRYGIERRPDEFMSDADNLDELTEALQRMSNAGQESRRNQGWQRDEKAMESKDGHDALKKLLPAIGAHAKRELDYMEWETGTGVGEGSFGSRSGGGRRLMVKRHGGSIAGNDKFNNMAEGLPESNKAAYYVQKIDTLAWAREDIFPDFQKPALPAWNEKWTHSSEKALEALKDLSNRLTSLSVTVSTYALREDKEVKQTRDWVVCFDRKSRAFLSKRIGEDYMDLSDGRRIARFFPQLKYVARRESVNEDLAAIGESLPAFMAPWADKLEHTHLISLDERDGTAILKLVGRHDPHSYIFIYLAGSGGPISKIEYFERSGNNSNKIRTIIGENIQEFNGLKLPTVYRIIRHINDRDHVETIIRLSDLKVNEALPNDLFKLDIPADWAIRDLDLMPKKDEQRKLSAPVDPTQNDNNFRRR